MGIRNIMNSEYMKYLNTALLAVMLAVVTWFGNSVVKSNTEDAVTAANIATINGNMTRLYAKVDKLEDTVNARLVPITTVADNKRAVNELSTRMRAVEVFMARMTQLFERQFQHENRNSPNGG